MNIFLIKFFNKIKEQLSSEELNEFIYHILCY